MKIRSLILPFVILCTAFASCSKNDEITSEFAPSGLSDLPGLYTYEDVMDSEDYFRVAVYFCEGDEVSVFVDTAPDEGGAFYFDGTYSYDPESGLGKINQNDGVELDFYADGEGFVILYDDDSEYEDYQDGIWLTRQDYTLGDFDGSLGGGNDEVYSCLYDDDFGCTSYNPESVLDIDDIGYQAAETKADIEWTVAGVAKWAGMNLLSGATGAIASTAMTAIMSQMGIGVGPKLKQISLKLEEIQKQLETVLQKIEVILDNQAEAQFNSHKTERNSLANTILPYFEKVMEETDETKRAEYLKEFNTMQGTIKTGTFMDNIASITVQKMSLYDAYDKYIYGCYPWEEQGYVARESFRALDMMTAFKGTVLAVLYYQGIGDESTAQAFLDKFATYLNYYNTTLVVRDDDHAVCQIPNCKIRINKKVDRRDFKTQTWLKNGTDFKSSYFESSHPIHMYWVPDVTAFNLAYGNNLGTPAEQYKKAGLSKDEIDKIIKFHQMPLQTILFEVAGCTNPFSESEMSGKTLCIMRGNNSCNYEKDETGIYASQSEMCISAYFTDNTYKLRKVGTPNIGHRNGKRLWYTFFIKREKIPVFNGWKNYNDEYLWCYPTVAR